MSFLENQSLQNKKIAAIHKFEKTYHEQKFLESVSISYHDISLNIEHNNTKFTEELNKELPKSWLNNELSSLKVSILGPEQFGLELNEWEDEAEQDCLLLDDETIAIQRDFIAKILNENHVLLITEVALCDGFYNFLRWALPRKMLEKNKYVLHSSCVLDDDGNAHFFLGHSGAGKTTITSLSQNKTILGDDMNVFFEEKGAFYASPGGIGGAFDSEVSFDKRFPVASLNWIIQSDTHKREFISESDSAIKLIASISNLFWGSLDDRFFQKILNFSAHASKNLDFFNLYFKKDKKFWNLLTKKETEFKINQNLQSQKLAGDFFLLDSQNEMIHELNGTGQWIYQKIEKNWDTNKIIEGLMNEFDIDHETARGDTKCLIDSLLSQKIIQPR